MFFLFHGIAQEPSATLIACSFDKQVDGDEDILFYLMDGTADLAGSSEIGPTIWRELRKYQCEP